MTDPKPTPTRTRRPADRAQRVRGALAAGGAVLAVVAAGATVPPALAAETGPATVVPAAVDAAAVDAAAAAPTRVDPILMILGSRSIDVRAWQLDLQILNFDPGPVDGVFGASTQTATQEFQRAYGRPVTGAVVRSDVALLAGYVAFDGQIENPRVPVNSPVRLQQGDRSDGVRAWQADLAAVQDNVLVFDGEFGADTDAATTEFQRSHGIVADGVVGPVTRREMVDALAAVR